MNALYTLFIYVAYVRIKNLVKRDLNFSMYCKSIDLGINIDDLVAL
jgi:hypothetical protein